MSRKDLAILVCLGNDTLRLYCADKGRVQTMPRGAYLHSLVIPLEVMWKIPFTDLPDEECFYRAFRRHKPGNAFYEKLAFFYYSRKENMSAEVMRRKYRCLIARKQLSTRPYWERYKREYKEQMKKCEKPKAALGLESYIQGLDLVDSAAAFIILKNKAVRLGEKWRNMGRN
jgi:hypothetical protein